MYHFIADSTNYVIITKTPGFWDSFFNLCNIMDCANREWEVGSWRRVKVTIQTQTAVLYFQYVTYWHHPQGRLRTLLEAVFYPMHPINLMPLGGHIGPKINPHGWKMSVKSHLCKQTCMAIWSQFIWIVHECNFHLQSKMDFSIIMWHYGHWVFQNLCSYIHVCYVIYLTEIVRLTCFNFVIL